MRLRRRPQGRVPVRLAPTRWEVWVRDQRWEGSTFSGLCRWLTEVNPQPLDEVTIVRNSRSLYSGVWSGIADDPTLW